MNALKPIFGRATDRRPGPFTYISLTAALVVIAMLGILVLHGRNTSPLAATATATPTVNPTALALAKQNEGLSTGTFIFDRVALTAPAGSSATPSAQDATPAGAVIAEEQAAQALQTGDYGQATTLFQQAVHDDPSNAEARIYLTDTQIDAAHAPNFVTLDIAVSFAPQDLETSRQVLRGVALAQNNLNQNNLLPGGAKVRIEVVSIGATTDAAPVLAQYYTDLLARGNPSHSLGVITWGSHFSSEQSLQPLLVALQGLAKDNVPVIAPVVTTDKVPASPNFFSLSPSDQTQGFTAAGVMMGAPINSTRAVVAIDPSSISNLEVGGYAAGAIQAKLGKNQAITDLLTPPSPDATGNVTWNFDQVVHDVRFYGATSVIYAGDTTGVEQLAVTLAKNGVHVPIITGANADSPELLGQGATPLAQFARDNADAMRAITIVSLADKDEWRWLSDNNPSKPNTPGFFDTFQNTYGLQNPLTPDANAIFSYDALELMLKSLVTSGKWTDKHMPTPADTRDALASVTDQHPFQGIGGRIAFDSNNAVSNRALAVKTIAVSPDTDANGNHLLGWRVLAILPTPQAFCATTACATS